MGMTAEAEMMMVLRSAMESREVVDVASEARRIAALYNADAEQIAKELTESGLLAGLNMAMAPTASAKIAVQARRRVASS